MLQEQSMQACEKLKSATNTSSLAVSGMKREPLFGALVILIASLALAGCQTAADRVGFFFRAQSHSEAYSGLDAATQDRLRHGIVKAGDTEEMVVIALGSPDSKSNHEGREKWTYLVFRGGELGGRHSSNADPGYFPRGQQVVFRPDQQNTFRVDEVLFHNGRRDPESL